MYSPDSGIAFDLVRTGLPKRLNLEWCESPQDILQECELQEFTAGLRRFLPLGQRCARSLSVYFCFLVVRSIGYGDLILMRG